MAGAGFLWSSVPITEGSWRITEFEAKTSWLLSPPDQQKWISNCWTGSKTLTTQGISKGFLEVAVSVFWMDLKECPHCRAEVNQDSPPVMQNEPNVPLTCAVQMQAWLPSSSKSKAQGTSRWTLILHCHNMSDVSTPCLTLGWKKLIWDKRWHGIISVSGGQN